MQPMWKVAPFEMCIAVCRKQQVVRIPIFSPNFDIFQLPHFSDRHLSHEKQIFTFEILYFILHIYIDPLLSVMENKPYKQVEDALGET